MEGSYRIYISYNLSKRLEWLCYDSDGMEWIDVPRQPEASVNFDKTLAVDAELLVFGRNHGGLDVIHKFSTWRNSWSLGREMNEQRCWFGFASLGEIAIVAGGMDAECNFLSSAEIYNSATGTWESLPRMNRPRASCSGVFMDGNFYVVGGIGEDKRLTSLTCGKMYDLGTRRWSEIPNMFPSQMGQIIEIGTPSLLVVAKNELYAAFYRENEVRNYDKGRNLWSTVGNLPEGVCIRHWGMTTLRAYGDQLILFVGVGEPSLVGVEVYECVPDEGPLQWNLLAFNYEPGLPRSALYNCTVMGC